MRMVVDLPAPLGPRKAQNLSAGDLEGDALHGFQGAKVLGEPLDLDHRSHGIQISETSLGANSRFRAPNEGRTST